MGVESIGDPVINRRVIGRFPAAASGSIPASARWRCMDKQTKHEIWILAVSAALLEAPFLAIAAVAVLGH